MKQQSASVDIQECKERVQVGKFREGASNGQAEGEGEDVCNVGCQAYPGVDQALLVDPRLEPLCTEGG